MTFNKLSIKYNSVQIGDSIMRQCPLSTKTKLQRPISKDYQFGIYLRLHNGNGCLLRVKPSEKIKNIFQSPFVKELGLPKNFRAVHSGIQITDFDLTVTEAQLRQNSIIHIDSLIQGESQKLKIGISIYYNNEKISIRVKLEDLLLKLKKQIFRLTKVSLRNQKLYFRGEQLKNDKTLAFYKLHNDSLIYLLNLNKENRKLSVEVPFNHVEKGEEECQEFSPRPMTNKITMMEQGSFQRSSRPINQWGSFQFKMRDADLGYEIEVRDAEVNREESQLQKLKDYTFNFKLFQSTVVSKNPEENPLQKTQSQENVSEAEKENSDNNEYSGLSFSQRLMII